MEFRETLLAAQRNQQQQSSRNYYYKAKFDPPKKEEKQKDRLSANIQKFLAKKDEEERQKKLEAQRKREELLAMRDPKALKKIQKTLKVIKSANKSVIADAVDRDNTAVTREGPEQPDQDDYGYESQAAAAIYEKMMQQYSKIPDEPKFPTSKNNVKRDLKGTVERVKHALQHEDDPVPHKRRRKGGTANDRDDSPPSKYEPEKEKKKEELLSKSEKSKIRKPAPPPMDFNQLLKLAEQKKSEPLDINAKKTAAEQETERLMTKKQKREYEEEMARRQRRQERLQADKAISRKVVKEDKSTEKEKKTEQVGFGRIPKIGSKNQVISKNDSPNRDRLGNDRDQYAGEKTKADRERHTSDRYGGDRDKISNDRERQREKDRARLEKERAERERLRLDKERLDKLKAERERIDRDIDRLNRDREKLDKTKSRLETNIQSEKSNKSMDRSKIVSREQIGKQDLKKNIDLKTQNTYRIEKNSNERKPVPNKSVNGKVNTDLNGKLPQKPNKEQLVQRNGVRDREMLMKQKSVHVNGSLKTLESKRPIEFGKTSLSKRPDEKSLKLQAGPSKPKIVDFDFDKHINAIGKNAKQDNSRKPGDSRRRPNPDDAKRRPKRRLDSDSEYDSEMDDFIDDADENLDYSRHIKEIFGYDKSKYRDVDDQDDPTMESSFARQQREEYISKKIGIMEDLEDMRMEAMEKKKSSKKKRRISDE